MTLTRMPFPGRYSPSDALLIGSRRQRISHPMPGAITKFACGNNVLEPVFAATLFWFPMFSGAAESTEQSEREMTALRKRRRISAPHPEFAVEASPTLLVGLNGSEFCQFFAHFTHPFSSST
ncbi:hypothetical protein [Mesorhizobium sp. WSM4304]|uniref:hypothetical protein n=1 Tax=Mesorhizobium sp. WSM4304 TaxID=2029408 RepID=UPI001FD8B15A|nr:hypothetical protein [Mesorhizobium sp. WSM4304]